MKCGEGEKGFKADVLGGMNEFSSCEEGSRKVPGRGDKEKRATRSFRPWISTIFPNAFIAAFLQLHPVSVQYGPMSASPLSVTIIGGGMITRDQILPTVYHLQRTGRIGKVAVSARRVSTLRALSDNEMIGRAFPGQSFNAYPSLTESEDDLFPDLYKEVLASMPPRQAVIVAIPEQDHYRVVMDTLAADQHVLCVKPLVLKYTQAREIRDLALEKGLFVGVEYHKRFDRRALIARQQYREGCFGEFVIGESKLIEPYYYRSSNFQNWFTADRTDPFVYIGCHYVDQVYFITGLRPVGVSVSGLRRPFSNGNEAFLWSHGRVEFENGSILSAVNGLGYPDDGAGSNDQGIVMFCEGEGMSGLISHNDQNRGVHHSYSRGEGPGGSAYNYVNPDYYKYVPWGGQGLLPVGYGHDSVVGLLDAILSMEEAVQGLEEAASLAARREYIRDIDERGLIATPANSFINELVCEAGRISILDDGRKVKITYGEEPCVA